MILLLGKSASGKDTIKNEIVNLGFKPIVPYTTRKKRLGETEGVEYHFVSKKKFFLMGLMGKLVGVTYYDMADGKRHYFGVSKESLKESKSVLIANPGNIKKLRRLKNVIPFTVYLDVSKYAIQRRLEKRGNQLENLRRMEADEKDFKDIKQYVDMVIDNNGLKKASFIANSIVVKYYEHEAKKI